jgi:hypothetical protein
MSHTVFLGESKVGQHVAGIHAHLVVLKLSTIATSLSYNYERRNWVDYENVHCIGKINSDQILIYRKPVIYAINLQQWLHNWYKELVIENDNDIDWSSVLNCQRYANKVIVNLGFTWPQQYPIADDVAPYFIDFYIKGRQTMAIKTETVK